jgi:hypothetical protein
LKAGAPGPLIASFLPKNIRGGMLKDTGFDDLRWEMVAANRRQSCFDHLKA